MTARNYLCTYNLNKEQVDHWKEILEKFYKESKARYCCGQLEKGEETEHPHIQFFLNFKNSVRPGTINKIDKRVHTQAVKINNGADNYCMKEETRVDGPLEFGEKPVKVNSKVDWEDVWNKAKEGKLNEIPATVRVIHYNKLKSIAKDNMKFEDKDHLRGIWIHGKAGAGKSRWVRDNCKESLYPKLCNKWWDGYQGEKYVVMDDIMPQHSVLAQQLKIWTDRYDCILETKGGACHAAYDYFIITSQYTIDEIFQDDKDREALHRRIQEFSIKDIQGLSLSLVTPCVYNTKNAA